MDSNSELKLRHFFEAAAVRKWGHIPAQAYRDAQAFDYAHTHPKAAYELPRYMREFLIEKQESLNQRAEKLQRETSKIPVGVPGPSPRIFRVPYQARA